MASEKEKPLNAVEGSASGSKPNSMRGAIDGLDNSTSHPVAQLIRVSKYKVTRDLLVEGVAYA